MKKRIFKSYLLSGLLLSASLLLSSCEKDPSPEPQPVEETPSTAKGPYEQGVFVINEGSSVGAVSYYNRSSKNVKTDIFQDVNSRPIGKFVQSMAVHNEKAYLIAGGSKKIEVVNANTFASLGTITGLEIPRYFVAKENKGYVTDYVSFSGAGRVAIIDLNTNTVTKTINVGINPELLQIVNNKLYVTNAGENFVSVINLETETVETPITVGYAPSSLVLDANNKLWVLCGESYGNAPGKLARINPATNAIEQSFNIPAQSASPQDLSINGAKNRLYYTLDNKVYSMGIADAALPATALINRSFYGLGIDPQDNIIYGADAGNFVSNGKVIRYNLTGAAIDSFTVSIAPNGFLFR